MATERVSDMTVEELRAFVQETVVEQLRIMGFVREGEEELWTKPIDQLTGAELLIRERRRRELP